MFSKIEKKSYNDRVKEYRAPEYLKVAAKAMYGKHIVVVGATHKELLNFWSIIERNAATIGIPYEVGRAVVDIDAKSHINTGTRFEEPDEFQIISSHKKGQSKTSNTSYRLQLTKQRENQVGANLNFDVGGPAFFNIGVLGLKVGGTHTRTVGEAETTTRDNSTTQSLSQTYQIMDSLKVPSKTKVRAVIRTWAVTYQADTVVQFSVDAEAALEFLYKKRFCCYPCILKTGYLTAKFLFADEEDYEIKDDILTFKRKGKISYLGEEVEITKEETVLQ